MIDEISSKRRFTAFSFVYALAILVHQVYSGFVVDPQPSSLLQFVALFSLLRPSSRSRVLALACAQLCTVAWEMPEVSNHWLFMATCSLGLILMLGPSLLFRAGRPIPNHQLAAAAAMIRVQLVILYAFATFAKLNSAFFDPTLSCAVEHYAWLVQAFPWLPDGAWTAYPAMGGTLAIEVALAAGLAFRRTRVAALILGWCFHFALGWNAFYDFSLVAAASYVMFLPDSVFEGWDKSLQRHPRLGALIHAFEGLGRSRWAIPALSLALLALLTAGALLDWPPGYLHLRANHIGKQIFVGIWLALGAVAGGLLLENGVTSGRVKVDWRRYPVLWIPPLLLTVNGLSPFLGLKTENSFSMFSNLQTEGEGWNHYLVPRSLRIFHFQDELIRVVDASDPRLERMAARGVRLVPLALRQLALENPAWHLRYEYRREVHSAAPVSADPFLGKPLNPLLRKLMIFRPVQPMDASICVH